MTTPDPDALAVPNEMIQFWGQEKPAPDGPLVTIQNDQNEPIVQILRNGTVRYADDVDLDEASRIFWRTLAADVPTVVPQSVPEFAEWFRNDLVYKAPETWPFHISWFLDELVRRYKDGAA